MFSRLPCRLTPRRRQELAQEIDEELRAHLAMRAEDNRRAGMSPEAAEADALARFGDPEQIAVACMQAEDNHPIHVLQRVASTVLTLTVGFGALALAIALAGAALLQPLRFHDADRLVRVGQGWDDATVPLEDFLRWRAESASFEQLVTFNAGQHILTGDGPAALARAMYVSDGYFDVFEVEPLLGRVFKADEVEERAAPIVLVSEAFWMQRYRRTMAILGRTMMLDGISHTIVGVMPEAAQLSHKVDIWRPLRVAEASARQAHYVVGRLREGVTLGAARQEIGAIATRTAPPETGPTQATFYPLRDVYAAPLRPTAWLVLGAALLVLVLAWAVTFRRALLKAARAEPFAFAGEAQTREVERLGITVVAAGVGLGLARAVREVVYETLFGRSGTLFDLHVDGMVAGVVLALALASGAGLMLVPHAVQQARLARFAIRRGLERSLSIVAVAGAVILLVVFGQTARSFLQATTDPLGFDEGHVLKADVLVREAGRTATVAVYATVMEAVRALPDVESASFSFSFPLQTDHFFSLPVALMEKEEVAEAYLEVVGADYFATMGIPLLAGRGIIAADASETEPVAVVNAAFAERYWPGKNPLGRQIDVGQTGYPQTVVGVVDNVHYFGGTTAAPGVVYLPYPQHPRTQMVLAIRSMAPPESLSTVLHATLSEVAPTVPVGAVRTATEVRREAFTAYRAWCWLLGFMSLAALGCAVLGIVQLVIDHVRGHLFHIEQARAQGARDVAVLLAAWRPALLTTTAGVLIGLGMAWGLLAQVRSGLLGEVDGVVFAWVVGAFLLVMLGASLIPARQALAVAPRR